MQQCKLCETVSLLTNASLKRAQKHVAEGRLFTFKTSRNTNWAGHCGWTVWQGNVYEH